jgi:hypothetical protein
MTTNYLKGFIVGSSLPIFALFFYNVGKMKNINYSYEKYTLVAPLYFGIMTCLAQLTAEITKLSLRMSIFIISIISSILVSSYITITKAYNFKSLSRWIKQYIIVTIAHLITYNVIIMFLLQNIC